MASGDAGDLYFEIQGPGGNAIEGGYQYFNDSHIQPYLRKTVPGTNGYISLNNNATNFAAGEILGLFNGITPNPTGCSPATSGSCNLAYMTAGALSSTQDPKTVWISSQAVQLVNPAWLFYPASPDMIGNGLDLDGNVTPCSGCSVSQVTSIAEGGTNSYVQDGSYFGVDAVGDNAISWLQVAFGTWDLSCVPTASVCPFHASSNPYVYYGGPQYYPNQDVSSDDEAPTGYGPYQTYDGIDAAGGAYGSSIRRTLGTFKEPLPPLPCTLDSHGYCLSLASETLISQCKTKVDGAIPNYRRIYRLYHARVESIYTQTDVFSGPPLCQTETIKWSPSDPRSTTGDPSLL